MKAVNHAQKKIVSIGSYNVGLTCHTGRVPTWGETLIGSGFSESYGGKGANQAVAAAKLGGDVTFIGCLGEDSYGDDGFALMNDVGIDTSHILRTNEVSTGVGIILINDEGDNCIIVDLGANNTLQPSHMDALEEVIASKDIVIFQLEIPLETVKRGMEIAHRHGKTVLFNPAPAQIEAIELLPLTTIINPNESELLILNGLDPSQQVDDKTCEVLARNLLSKGPKAVIVTRGEKDCMVVTSEETHLIPPIKVEAVDTTGAGDSFTGALAIALSEGKNLVSAVTFANATGSYCVTKKEVIPGLPTREELEEFQKTMNRNESGDTY